MKTTKKLISVVCVLLVCLSVFTIAASAAQDMPALPTLRRNGSENTKRAVKVLQRMLISAGYNCGDSGVDGIFGSDTEKAVKRFQKDNNLTIDGIVGTKTWKKLCSKSKVERGDKGDLVKLAQTILNLNGYNCKRNDGVFDKNTKNAVIAFQKDWNGTSNGADGIIDGPVWKALILSYLYDFD